MELAGSVFFFSFFKEGLSSRFKVGNEACQRKVWMKTSDSTPDRDGRSREARTSVLPTLIRSLVCALYFLFLSHRARANPPQLRPSCPRSCRMSWMNFRIAEI